MGGLTYTCPTILFVCPQGYPQKNLIDMETATFLHLVLLALSCLAAVVSMWFARKNNVRELENDVSEIAGVVEKVYRENKRAQMRRVRAAAETSDFPVPPGAEGINPAASENLTPFGSKEALRRRVFGGKP